MIKEVDTFKVQSDIITYSKYAKHLHNLNRRESYDEIIERYLQMMYDRFSSKLHDSINHYGKSLYNKESLPSMRMLQFAGEAINRNQARGYNCCFMPINQSIAFRETMFLLLSGTGVGYSVEWNNVKDLPRLVNPKTHGEQKYLIADSIEGWADAVDRLFGAYFGFNPYPRFDFSDIRQKGQLLITSGGKAPGPEPLRICLEQIDKLLNKALLDFGFLKPIHCHDIQCYIADAVLAGGIRRAAMIALFDWNDKDMLYCKSDEWWNSNPQRARANNSVVFYRYWSLEDQIDRYNYFWNIAKESKSGEPAIIWLSADNQGFNPCAEALLRNFSFCNLTTMNAGKINNYKSFIQQCETISFFGTLQASFTDFHYLNPKWIKTTEEDALLGCSITGILSNTIDKKWLNYGATTCVDMNKAISSKIGINTAARVTLGKPEGTSSLLLGTSSGIHPWHNSHYIRRYQFNKNESIWQYLSNLMPELCEDYVYNPENAGVFMLPIEAPYNSTTRKGLNEIEHLELLKYYNQNWVFPGRNRGEGNHNMSTTISVREDKWDIVGNWMWDNREYYSGISVLPYDGGSYTQAPFEDITPNKYKELLKLVKNINLDNVMEYENSVNFSDNIACGANGCSIM